MKLTKRIIVIIGIIFLLYISYFLYKNRDLLISSKQLQAKLEIPIIYKIDNWPVQHIYKIDSFSANISKKNDWETLITYTVKGRYKRQGNFKPFIKEVHISEKLVGSRFKNQEEYFHLIIDPNDTTIYGEIEITPIIDLKQTGIRSYGSVDFEFTNEHIIHSYKLWHNKFRFVCGPFMKDIEYNQAP